MFRIKVQTLAQFFLLAVASRQLSTISANQGDSMGACRRGDLVTLLFRASRQSQDKTLAQSFSPFLAQDG
jgi:hypothetical protein